MAKTVRQQADELLSELSVACGEKATVMEKVQAHGVAVGTAAVMFPLDALEHGVSFVDKVIQAAKEELVGLADDTALNYNLALASQYARLRPVEAKPFIEKLKTASSEDLGAFLGSMTPSDMAAIRRRLRKTEGTIAEKRVQGEALALVSGIAAASLAASQGKKGKRR